LTTNFDHPYEDVGTPPVQEKIAQTIGDAGVQMDLRFTWLSRLDMTFFRRLRGRVRIGRPDAPRSDDLPEGDAVTVAVGLLPVLLFLLALIYLDSYSWSAPAFVAGALAAGCLLAVLCWFVNAALESSLAVAPATYSRYVAPIVEELAKAFLIWRSFARTGSVPGGRADLRVRDRDGFAVVENLYYWHSLANRPSASGWSADSARP